MGLDWGKGSGHVYSRGNLLILNDCRARMLLISSPLSQHVNRTKF